MSITISSALEKIGVIWADEAQSEAPVQSGDLSSSIFSEVQNTSLFPTIIVGVDPTYLGGDVNYAPFVHGGTGVYGPRKKRIYPKTKKVLKIPGIGYVRSIKGQKANPFLERSLERALPEIERILAEEIDINLEGIE